jgi:hypothetical protein
VSKVAGTVVESIQVPVVEEFVSVVDLNNQDGTQEDHFDVLSDAAFVDVGDCVVSKDTCAPLVSEI